MNALHYRNLAFTKKNSLLDLFPAIRRVDEWDITHVRHRKNVYVGKMCGRRLTAVVLSNKLHFQLACVDVMR
jgi:hypothetical protein